MYKIYTRRNKKEKWTPWVVLEDTSQIQKHIDWIESYGWEWQIIHEKAEEKADD